MHFNYNIMYRYASRTYSIPRYTTLLMYHMANSTNIPSLYHELVRACVHILNSVKFYN